jgi:hypothetical protein
MARHYFFPVLALGAWLAVTSAPIVLALTAWRLAPTVRHSWIVHILLIPVLLTVEWMLTDLLFFAAGDTGDGPPGLGLALLPSLGVLLLTIVVYYIRLSVNLVSYIAAKRRRA